MAIYQRDREFQRIISEIKIDVIPLRFIKNVICSLEDGTRIVLGREELEMSDEDNERDLEHLIKKLDFYEDLSDLQIRIDYQLVEKDVDDCVQNLLNKKT